MMRGSTPSRRSGLTIIEVLAATVLLSLLSIVAVGLLRATASSRDAPTGISVAELSVLADAVIAMPGDFGLASNNDQPFRPRRGFTTAIEWPDTPRQHRVLISRIDHHVHADAPPLDHAWIVFAYGENAVMRYVPVFATEDQR